MAFVFGARGTVGGKDHLASTARQPDKLIRSYLHAIRSVNGRLVLDIQPGRADVSDEIEALEKWIDEPDVDVSIDPEWDVGRRGVPGQTAGKIRASGPRADLSPHLSLTLD